jgi:hypothetical protein
LSREEHRCFSGYFPLLPQYAVLFAQPFVLAQKLGILCGHLGFLGKSPNPFAKGRMPNPQIRRNLTPCQATGERNANRIPLDAWIDSAIESEIIPIVRFARTLRRDIDAVRNAIELPWSNGQAEGHINRLKTLKRAMYGRAGPELLWSRMLPFRHTL